MNFKCGLSKVSKEIKQTEYVVPSAFRMQLKDKIFTRTESVLLVFPPKDAICHLRAFAKVFVSVSKTKIRFLSLMLLILLLEHFLFGYFDQFIDPELDY